jgi:spermidine synthase
MNFPLDRVVICEVNPDVIEASRKHFGPWLNGLFDDPRVQVLPEDGRTWLAATEEHFDLVIADIFLSFKAGVGSLYTLEHFRAVRDHLNPGGMFVQWLPMFDVSVPEFEIITRTMLEVFPSVTLWRRSLSPRFSVYALIGKMEQDLLRYEELERDLQFLRTRAGLDERVWLLNIPLAAYAGNMSAQRERFANAPVNTDDRTLLEYVAPKTERNSRGAGQTQVLAWRPLLDFCEQLLSELPPEDDPYLREIPPAARNQVRAGLAYYGFVVHQQTGDAARAQHYFDRYQKLVGGS